MRSIKFIMLVAMLFGMSLSSFSKDVHVRGYYRKDGTYVRPHVRSSPDQYKYNNYGPSKTDDELMNGKSRDNDNDGTPNYLDTDDDNDGKTDDNDNTQYGGEDSED